MTPISKPEESVPSSTPENALSSMTLPSSIPKTSPKDTVESHSTDQLSSTSFAGRADIPTLSAPASTHLSISEMFRTWTATMRDFKNVLKASALSDLDTRKQLNELSLNQALGFLEVLKEKENLIANLDQIVKGKEDEFISLLSPMSDLPKELQKEIKKINAGNKTEQAQHEKIADAYQTCLDKIKDLGAEDLGNGHYSIPPGQEKKYSKAIKEYQKALSSFNQYWEPRFEQIASYNSAAESYNQQAGEANLLAKAFILDNNLSEFLQQNGTSSPELPPAQQRDISNSLKKIKEIGIAADGSSVHIEPLPAYMTEPSQIALPDLPPTSIDELLKADISAPLRDQIYESAIAPLNNALVRYNLYMSFAASDNVDAKDEANDKKLSLFKKEEKEYTKQVKKALIALNRNLESSLALQRIELDRKDIQTLMGSRLIKIALLNEEVGNDSKKDEALTEKLTQKLLFLSLGLLSNLSIHSLLPGIGLLADEIDSLPKESPAFTLLFAVSLANRICENIHSKLTGEVVKKFISSLPESADFPPDALSRVEAALNVGQLMIASKLLEESLGLTGLLPSFLSSSFPSLDVDKIAGEATEEDSKTKAYLLEKLHTHFMSQGYPEDKAVFLAQGAAEINAKTLLAPPILSRISEKTIDLNLLQTSLGMELALIHSLPLPEAQRLSNRALALTCEQGPFHSSEQFRSSLKPNLADLGVPDSGEIALALPLYPLLGDRLTYSSDPEPSLAAIGHRVDQLLPQLNHELRKEIAVEITKTLVSTSPPFLDLTHIFQQEVSRLKKGDDAKLTEALHATFIESIKTMTSFPEFALKLLDPAHQYLNATSLIYRKNDKPHRGDIPI